MTLEDAKQKLADMGVGPPRAWSILRRPSLQVRRDESGAFHKSQVDSVRVYRYGSDKTELVMTIPEAEEFSNALRVALYCNELQEAPCPST